ncbi:MAG: LysM peptidoglycan-binding domain-containing protein [Turicibacter sp.]|nr:LysM peptidoglycan-binding domain-containing protein [Turicibacter sp.]
MKIHITKQGETIEEVAGQYSVSQQDLIGINPHINLTSNLVSGLKLKIPDVIRAKSSQANEHIEKFYPNLENAQSLNEHAVPIGMKPFPEAQGEATAVSGQHHAHTPEHTTPWSHLNEQVHALNKEAPPHHPWNPGSHHFSSLHPHHRLIVPPMPYYPPPYPYYGYPPYGYGYGVPIPIPGFGPGFGGGWHGGHGGWHGGGFHGGGGHHR